MNKIFATILSIILSLGTGSNIDNNKYCTYTNENLSFSLEIPSEWDGYYNTVEKAQSMAFMFVGECDACTKYNESGLLMFYIISDEILNEDRDVLDNVKKIGTAHGIDYYYATSTDASLGPIMSVNENFINDAIEQYGEEQTELMKRDWEKAQEMTEDIPDILQSFKEI